MWTLIGTIAGWIAGFAGSILTPYITERRQRKFERRGLAAALKGEIDAILLIANHRKYIEDFERDIQELRKPDATTFGTNIAIRQNYFEIYSANATKIGTLGHDISIKVVEAYTLTKSFFEDVETIRSEFQDHPLTKQPANEVQAKFYEKTLGTLKSATLAGKEASIKLGAYLDREEHRWYQAKRKEITEAETSALKALQEGNKVLLLEKKNEETVGRGMDRFASTSDKLREQFDGAKLAKENESQKG